MSSIYVSVISDAIYVDKSTPDEDINNFIQLRKMINIPKIVIEQKNDVFKIHECLYIDVSNLNKAYYIWPKIEPLLKLDDYSKKFLKENMNKISELDIKGLNFKSSKVNVFAYVKNTIESKDLEKDISKYFNSGEVIKKTIDTNNKPAYVDNFVSYTNMKSDNIIGVSRTNSYTIECDVYSRTFFFPVPSIYENTSYFTNVLLRSNVYANVNNLIYSHLESMYINNAHIVGVEGVVKEKTYKPMIYRVDSVGLFGKLPSILDIIIHHIPLHNDQPNHMPLSNIQPHVPVIPPQDDQPNYMLIPNMPQHGEDINAKIVELPLNMIDTSDVYLFLYDNKNVYAFKNIKLDKSYVGDISKAKVMANDSKVVLYDSDYSIVNELSGDIYIAKNLTRIFTLSKQFMYMLYTNDKMFIRADDDYLYVPKYKPNILAYTNKPRKTVIDKDKVSLYVTNDMKTFAKVEYRYNKIKLNDKTIESLIWDNIKSNYNVIYEDNDIMVIYGRFVYSQTPYIASDVNLRNIFKLILEPTSTSNIVKGMVTIYKKSLSYDIIDKGDEYLPSMFACAYNTRSKSLYGSVYIGKTISYSLDADITYGTFDESIKSDINLYRYKFEVFPYVPIKLYITQIDIEQGTPMYTVNLKPFKVNKFDIMIPSNKIALYYSLDIKSKPVIIRGPIIISGDYSRIKTFMFSMIVNRHALCVSIPIHYSVC